MNSESSLVQQHYDASAENYHLQYEGAMLSDINRDYPANYFRLQLLINSFVRNNVKRVIEVGVGEGTPLVSLAKSGMNVSGFDISKSMVSASRENFKKNGYDENKIIWEAFKTPLLTRLC